MVEVTAFTARRARMLRAAEEALDTVPFGTELALAQVAKRAGVGPSTLRRTWGAGDEGLVRALAEQRAAEMWRRTAPRIGESVHTHLVRGLGEVMQMWREHAPLWAAVMRLTITSEDFSTWWHEQVMGSWTPMLAEAFAAPAAPDEDPEAFEHRVQALERQVAFYLDGAWITFYRTARHARMLRAQGQADQARALEDQTLHDVVALGCHAFDLAPDPAPR